MQTFKKLLIFTLIMLFGAGITTKCQPLESSYSFNNESRVTELSYNPADKLFFIYWNDYLSVQSKTIEETNIQKIFSYDTKLDHTQDSIYFCLHPNFYKIYLHKEHLLFTIRLPYGSTKGLGDHLLMFIETIRLWHKQQLIHEQSYNKITKQ